MKQSIPLLLALLFSISCAETPHVPASSGAGRTTASSRNLASYDPEINALLAQMTIDEKIGQMTQAEQDALENIDDLSKYSLGSVLSGGDSDPSDNSLQSWTDLYDRLQTEAMKSRLGIPILYGIDAVHGHNNVLGAVVFPHNIGLGCTRNPELVRRAAEITAREVRATGINWTFAPCIAVPRDERWGRTYEGFGETPELAKSLGAAAVKGYQREGLGDPLGVLACAKHYAGDGGTAWGTGLVRKGIPGGRFPLDRGDVRLSEQELRDIHIAGYVDAIKAGAGTIMPSYSSWNGVKCSGSRRLLTEILKDELGFEGFLISDYAALDELPGDYATQIATSINAGMDMVMVPTRYREFMSALRKAVDAGRVPVARIDDAVRRILRVKFAMGLMDKSANHFADRSLHPSFGSREHRAVARQCVRESLVLLKNQGGALPLAKNLPRVHVAGRNADDIGNQCGGWTIAWQGRSGAVTTGGTTILEGIRNAVGSATKVTFSRDGRGANGASAGIVVVGETPYAEMDGDRRDLALAPEDAAAIANVKNAGIPVVVVLLSGRPLILGKSLDEADAFVAAWLPGTEGQGVADVLFGDFKPLGKLSHSWPRSMDQIPINEGDEKYDPLFPYGHGLTY
ncbi:MAG: glycoside hydrolase family 3 C-terminal domain-containing protein [Bryobacteraceae bacterium]|nr:glycoside hydrolase family 3 C-terminal domain-containing protein [Bryobacteraceae bacterium]